MKAKKGFTLVEILIVVVILGILAAIVIPQFTNASEEARESSLKSNLQSLRSQIHLYKIRSLTNSYPATLAAMVPDFLLSLPDNPFTDGQAEDTDWDYDAGTGILKAGTSDTAEHRLL